MEVGTHVGGQLGTYIVTHVGTYVATPSGPRVSDGVRPGASIAPSPRPEDRAVCRVPPQNGVRPRPPYPAPVEPHDLVGLGGGGEAVGDGEAGAGGVGEGAGDEVGGDGVEAGGGVVQDQEAGGAGERPCQAEALEFAAGEGASGRGCGGRAGGGP